MTDCHSRKREILLPRNFTLLRYLSTAIMNMLGGVGEEKGYVKNIYFIAKSAIRAVNIQNFTSAIHSYKDIFSF